MPIDQIHHTENLLHQINRLSVLDAIAHLVNMYPNQVVFSTSFSEEDQVISHHILHNKFNVQIFTLDTGRMFPETYSVWNSTIERYNTNIKAYYPQAIPLQNFIESNGPNAFYAAVALRKQCCQIRKVEPLKRALTNQAIWITGLRAEHSANREALPLLEWDENNKLYKYHPLLHWSTSAVKEYIKQHNIPYNPLHDKGFVSIGCAPCTRAIKPGEDVRAGRWWWEDANKKECGLHA